MNEHLESEKEAGAYEVAGCVVEERSVRKSRQAMAKRAYPSSSAGDSNWKKARREPGAKFHRGEILDQSWAL